MSESDTSVAGPREIPTTRAQLPELSDPPPVPPDSPESPESPESPSLAPSGDPSGLRALRARAADCSLADAQRLRRRIDGLHRTRDRAARARAAERIATDITRAERLLARRAAAVPAAITYPDLPVSARRDDLLEALREHQVVVVAGETGSGKTTQLPKMLLELGFGVRGRIGHTQPRRIAARAVAERVAEELGTPLGHAVGYTIRFNDHVRDDTLIKVMTDGVLLAEIRRDPLLLGYDALIIDEAHERSLNIDFLLGYLHRLLDKRPDLKIIITSATIDPQRFAEHFGQAPVVEVSGRTFPVEIRYRPWGAAESARSSTDDADDAGANPGGPDDQTAAVIEAIGELSAHGPGDILVFLSGEREIRDTADALRRSVSETTEVVPLYGRLSAAEQHRVFSPHTGRRIVLSTNVAETSLTVPGIRYVVDTGTARISRYSQRLKVQRLPIEPISQASAQQRSGRCGRVEAGIAIRLYSEKDFDERPLFTDPEIRRTNLAAVLLQMASLGLGSIEDFPFLDPPDRRAVRDGTALLEELGALDDSGALTEVGRSIARLPVDPRMGRMLIEAAKTDCLRDVLVIVAGLTVQDPRERPREPAEDAAAAATMHARFVDKTSDVLAYLNLWNHILKAQEELSGSAFRRLCRREHLHYLRVREWQDLHGQLTSITKELGMESGATDAHPDVVHRAMLSGLLSHIGLRVEPTERPGVKGRRPQVEYAGARNSRFVIAPGSALSRDGKATFVVAVELVETSRLYARTVARIDPGWAEILGAHLVKRSYSLPHWESKRGAAVALERVTLFGVTLAHDRKVDFARLSPTVARELFIRHALVEGDWRPHAGITFPSANAETLKALVGIEDRVRRRGITADDDTLYAFYDARVPSDVVSTRHFESWWRRTSPVTPHLLNVTISDLLEGQDVSLADYPDTLMVGDIRVGLKYRFDPGADDDGLTVEIPMAVLSRTDADTFDWLVPGMRRELVTELMRTLPKALRRSFVPIADRGPEALTRLSPYAGAVVTQLAADLSAISGIAITAADFDLDALPYHMRPNYVIVNDKGRAIASGRDLAALQDQLSGQVRAALSATLAGMERHGFDRWPDDLIEIPTEVSTRQGQTVVVGYPALADEGSAGVAVRVLETSYAAAQSHRAGIRRLLARELPAPVKPLLARLSNLDKLTLGGFPAAPAPAVLDDCLSATIDLLVDQAGGPARTPQDYRTIREHVRAELADHMFSVVTRTVTVLSATARVRAALDALTTPATRDSVVDARAQLAALVPAGFVTRHGAHRLPDIARYLQALEVRLAAVPGAPQRDGLNTDIVQRLSDERARLQSRAAAGSAAAEKLDAVIWDIEELRVSLFAQRLRTAYPISEKRVRNALAAAAALIEG